VQGRIEVAPRFHAVPRERRDRRLDVSVRQPDAQVLTIGTHAVGDPLRTTIASERFRTARSGPQKALSDVVHKVLLVEPRCGAGETPMITEMFPRTANPDLENVLGLELGDSLVARVHAPVAVDERVVAARTALEIWKSGYHLVRSHAVGPVAWPPACQIGIDTFAKHERRASLLVSQEYVGQGLAFAPIQGHVTVDTELAIGLRRIAHHHFESCAEPRGRVEQPRELVLVSAI
jgi:hypothetical protein